MRRQLPVAGAGAVRAVRRLWLAATHSSAPLLCATTPARARDLTVVAIGCDAAARLSHHRPAIALPAHRPAAPYRSTGRPQR